MNTIRIYRSWDEAVYREIAEPINSCAPEATAEEYDIETIANECLAGDGFGGCFLAVSPGEFWSSVEKNYIG